MTDNHNFPDDLLLPTNMIQLYARGAFPMAESTGEINWYLPEIRTIIPLDGYNVPRSLRKFMESVDFEYRYDTAVMEVVRQCANRPSTWISERLIEAYKGLYDLGHLHSVEVWQKNKLVGGLYGVTYKGAFFGESMFSAVSQASKCALIKLIERLNDRGFVLLDVQYENEHLKMFGTVQINYEEYHNLLIRAYKKNVVF
ncbi:leucyl/phenylalanyl-tRNA--protein transferase [Melioribacter sp. OK-6-Me]|uniref:leucyl/phenylalanyl-tRNA--protein transferase n=1 Tax=unclassified Melioribacter TaxID=2627329 RepID=UPI003ED95FDE